MSDRLGSLKLLFPKLEIQVPRRGNCSFSMWELEFLRVETRVSNCLLYTSDAADE